MKKRRQLEIGNQVGKSKAELEEGEMWTGGDWQVRGYISLVKAWR